MKWIPIYPFQESASADGKMVGNPAGRTVRSSTANFALLFGMAALVFPAVGIAVIWFLSLDKDYAFLLYIGTVALAIPPGLIAGIQGCRRAATSGDRWLARSGLMLGLVAVCAYLLGGIGYLFLVYSVLRHD
jgi:hypothetical protein